MQTFYTLVSSLPVLPVHFDAGKIDDSSPPITARTLSRRLSILEDDQRAVLRQLSDFFLWDRQPIDRTDEEVIQTQRRVLAEIRNPMVRHIIEYRFEMRALVAAIRCRRDDLPPPQLLDHSLASTIKRHWEQPHFGLSGRYPWLVRFADSLDQEQPREAQRELFSELWRHWSRLNERYHFSFESIVLYLARWEILDRWTSQDAARGRERFDSIVDRLLVAEDVAEVVKTFGIPADD